MTSIERLRGVVAALAVMIGVAALPESGLSQAVITGRVTSEQGIQLDLATVRIIDLNIEVLTNSQGVYTINVPGERVRGQTVTVRARRIGFAPASRQIVLSAGRQELDLSLKVDLQRLSEVVSTGVSDATERAKLPFTVATVDVSSLPSPSADPLTLLQGRVPGVTIVSISGRPGSEASVILRAPNSINAFGRGQEPLFVVDGIVLEQGLIDINPSDIVSIEVVKGAAAASLYGARAGNGVLQLTTRRGAEATGLRFGSRVQYGVNDIEHYFGLAENHTYRLTVDGSAFCAQAACTTSFSWPNEILRLNSTASALPLPPQFAPTNNGTNVWNTFQVGRWPGQTYNAIDQVVDPGPYVQADVNVTARTGNTNFFTSLGYLDQQGSFIGLRGYQRGSARLNLDQRVGDDWNIQLSTYYSRSREDGVGLEQSGATFFDLTRMPRGVDLFMRDTVRHEYIIRPDLQGENENPVYAFTYLNRGDQTARFLGGLNIHYQPLNWFDMRGTASFDRADNLFEQFNDKGYRSARTSSTVNNGQIFQASNADQSWGASLAATARRDFGIDVRTSLQARYTYGQQDLHNAGVTGRDLAVRGVADLDNARSPQIFVTSGESSIRRIGYFLNGIADIKDRYYVDALVRRDGSSLFGPDNRWANFGRIGASWRLTNEPWFTVPKVDEFKLRYAVGTAGNSPSFAAQYEAYQLDNGNFEPTTLGNRNLGPERLTETEVGVDMSLFSRLALTVTRSSVVTKDQILPVPLVAAAGFATQWRNAGTMEGNTWEITAEIPWISRPDMSFTTRFTYDRSRATITELNVAPFTYGLEEFAISGDQNLEGVFYARVGERYGTMYGVRWATSCADLPSGTDCAPFRTNDEGYFVWTGGADPGSGATHSGSGAVTVAPGTWGTAGPILTGRTTAVLWGAPIIAQDSTGSTFLPLGNALPKYRWAFNPVLVMKRFTATALVDASVGRSVYNQGRQWSYFENYSHDQDQADKSDAELKPIGYYGSSGLYNVLQANSHFVEDGSFTKLREVTVAYHFGALPGIAGDWTATLIGRNLKTWTDYKGFDPEVGAPGGQSASGVINAFDSFRFPNLRTISFALQTSF